MEEIFFNSRYMSLEECTNCHDDSQPTLTSEIVVKASDGEGLVVPVHLCYDCIEEMADELDTAVSEIEEIDPEE